VKNSAQVKVDLSKENQIWHYLGKTSTELRAQYTEDITKPLYNIKSNFLDSIPKPPKPAPMAAPPKPKRPYLATFPQGVLPKVSPVPLPGAVAASLAAKQDRPYIYKPRPPSSTQPGGFQFATQQFAPTFPPSPASQGPMPQGLMSQLQPHQFAQRPSQPQPQPQPQQPQQPVYHQQALQPRQGPQVAHQAQGQHQHPSQKPPSQQPLQIEQYRPLAMDPRPKKSSAAFSSDRFAPVGGSNGFPQLPGLTWPPAHMKSGHHFQPHADAAANGPPPTPMTSSAIKSLASAPQPNSPGAQPQAGAHQKYTFFQIHNNRDSARYRTPYGLRGGFTNGYEGNLRTFLIKAQRALSGDKTPLKATSSSSLQPLQPRPVASPGPSGSPSTGYGSPYSRLLPRPPQTAAPRFAVEAKRDASPAQYLAQSAAGPVVNGHGPPGALPIHPAYRQQSGSWLQSPASQAAEERPWSPYPNSPAPHSGEPHSRPPSQHGATSKAQSFTKQSHSPIPLPPYVKQAAATSSAPATKTSPLSDPLSQRNPLVKSAEPMDGSNSAPYQHQQPQPPPATAEPPFDTSTAPAPPQGVSGQYIQPQQIQWASTYSAEASPTTRQFEPSPPAYSTPQQPPPTTYHPATDQQQGQPVAQYSAPQPGYLNTPAAVDASADSVSMVERLMMNLKRATQQERSD
jgi:hypothetical protein